MDTQAVTIELSRPLYRAARQIARVTGKSLPDVLEASIAVALPPLNDVTPETAVELAALVLLDDAALWRIARAVPSASHQDELHQLLERQAEDVLEDADAEQLRRLMNGYGQDLVRQAHAYLLLARRGYRVPMQAESGSDVTDKTDRE